MHWFEEENKLITIVDVFLIENCQLYQSNLCYDNESKGGDVDCPDVVEYISSKGDEDSDRVIFRVFYPPIRDQIVDQGRVTSVENLVRNKNLIWFYLTKLQMSVQQELQPCVKYKQFH